VKKHYIVGLTPKIDQRAGIGTELIENCEKRSMQWEILENCIMTVTVHVGHGVRLQVLLVIVKSDFKIT
jgi:hypothetical protein